MPAKQPPTAKLSSNGDLDAKQLLQTFLEKTLGSKQETDRL